MDRAAKLAAEARTLLAFDLVAAELPGITKEMLATSTRKTLAARAADLGYSTELEISAAIDEALTAAGATP